MIYVAASNQEQQSLFDDQASATLSLCFGDFEETPDGDRRCKVAFVGFSVWRREENGDGNLSDQQVFVVRNGQIRPLRVRTDLCNHSPDGFSWGYAGSGPAQLALAMLMEVLDDWSRVQRLYQRFKECVTAQVPQDANWTADGADVYAWALRIENGWR
jgi:Family of unknown function (DUF6166)